MGCARLLPSNLRNRHIKPRNRVAGGSPPTLFLDLLFSELKKERRKAPLLFYVLVDQVLEGEGSTKYANCGSAVSTCAALVEYEEYTRSDGDILGNTEAVESF